MDRVAVDQSGAVILDADGDEVQTGPGFDYEVAKATRGSSEPARNATPLPLERLSPKVADVLGRAQRMADVFGHPWVGTEHLGLALLEGGRAAAEVLGTSWETLARAVAAFYDGPAADARMALVTERLVTEWQPVALPNDLAPEPNSALCRLLARSAEAVEAGNLHRPGVVDVARQLAAPERVENGDGSTFAVPSLVTRLLERCSDSP